MDYRLRKKLTDRTDIRHLINYLPPPRNNKDYFKKAGQNRRSGISKKIVTSQKNYSFMTQLSFLMVEKTSEIDISGLIYIPDFITRAEHDYLLSQIDRQQWLTDIKRRVQHYGYRYDYKARTIGKDACLGPLPDWLSSLSKKLNNSCIFPSIPDQVIVNEYLPGQGISAHIDCVPCFADTIASLSLGSPCIMEFSNPKTGVKKSIVLEERSLIVLSGPARYEWQHSIPARKSDIINGVKTERARRVSLTFRKVTLN